MIKTSDALLQLVGFSWLQLDQIAIKIVTAVTKRVLAVLLQHTDKQTKKTRQRLHLNVGWNAQWTDGVQADRRGVETPVRGE